MQCDITNYTNWKAISTIRICHPTLDPDILTKKLETNPSIVYRPGESKIHYGKCKSAGYWCTDNREDYPTRPDSVFGWSEEFVLERESVFRDLLNEGYRIDIYVGIFSEILALGFNLPPTPTLWKLGIPIGIEFFAA